MHWVYEHEGLKYRMKSTSPISLNMNPNTAGMEMGMGHLSMKNLIMQMGDRSLHCNPYHLPIPCRYVLILQRSQLQSRSLLKPHICTPYWPISFFGDQLPTPLTLNSAMCNCPAPLFPPASLAHLLITHCQGVIHWKGCWYWLQSNSRMQWWFHWRVLQAMQENVTVGFMSLWPTTTPPPICHLIFLYIGLYNMAHPNVSNCTNPLYPLCRCAHAYQEETWAQGSYHPPSPYPQTSKSREPCRRSWLSLGWCPNEMSYTKVHTCLDLSPFV